LKEKVLEENRRIHALEHTHYLERHPEQTNFFQQHILNKTLARFRSAYKNQQAHILDLGCGTGYLYRRLLDAGFKMTGADISTEMIDVLQGKVLPEAAERSKLVVADAESFLTQAEAQYDGIVQSALLHHLYDYESMVREYCGRLRPGGLFLVFFEPIKQKFDSSLKYALHQSLAKFDEIVYRLEMSIRNIPLFEDEYEWSDYQRRFGGIDPEKLAGILREAGMEILEINKYCSRRYGINALIANQVLGTENTFNLLARKNGDAI